MEAPRTLVLLPYSPWSERARWALDHHRLAYQTIVHAPVIGERRLRKLVAGRVRPATVPVLIEGETVLTDSWDIAAHADRVGAGPALLAEGRVEEAKRWAGVCDAAMCGGRALVVAGLLRTPAALDESMPPAVPAHKAERRHDDGGRAEPQRLQDRADEAHVVVGRQPTDDHVVGAHPEVALDHRQVGEQVGVAEHHALGVPGGAGGVLQECELVGLPLGFLITIGGIHVDGPRR